MSTEPADESIGEPETSLWDRRVAMHVSGSVAAYKACEVITTLRQRGAEVRVAMTAGADHFITPTTLQALSGHPVLHEVWESESSSHGMGHLGLATWGEIHVVVAASANLLARMAAGFADDAVTATLLASRRPPLIAPAMETAMWEHSATQANVAVLEERGSRFVGPVVGRLASGAAGVGRLAEPLTIVDAIADVLSQIAAS